MSDMAMFRQLAAPLSGEWNPITTMLVGSRIVSIEKRKMTPNNTCLRSALPTDAEVIARIYNYYIQNTVVTFEEEPVSPEAMAARIADVQDSSLPWLVAEMDGALVGYAYANKWKIRSAYRYSVETTIYLEPGRERLGIGKRLYSELLSLLRARGIHVAIGGAALPMKRVWLCMKSSALNGSQHFARLASSLINGLMSATGS